jgi:hypothetical protein
MKRRSEMSIKVFTMMGIAVVLSMAVVSVRAEAMVRVNVPFEFMVGKTVLPAGQYSIIRTPEDLAIRIVGEGKAAAAEVTVVTRLAGGIHITPKDAHIVFDKIGDTCILSELWIPGTDGFLLYVTKGKHEHKVINSPA